MAADIVKCRTGIGIVNGVVIAAVGRRRVTREGSGHRCLGVKHTILQMDLESFRCRSPVVFQDPWTNVTHIHFQFVIIRNDGARGIFNGAVKRAVPLLPAAIVEVEANAPITIVAAIAVLQTYSLFVLKP